MGSIYGRVLSVDVEEGVRASHVYAYLYASFITIGFVVFVNIGQAYVINEILNVPIPEQGRLTGNLAFWTEIIIISLVGVCGVLSDRIGRRAVFAFGITFIGMSYAFYPLASSEGELTAYRLIYAVGVAASTGMLGTIVQDYPRDRSRGRLIALGGVFNGLGALFVTIVFRPMPQVFQDMGATPVEAGMYMHWIATAICLTSALIIGFGLKGGTPAHPSERPPLLHLAQAGLNAARNPRIALAYSSAFVARSDLVILGTFTVLWGTVAGRAQGLSTAEAVREGATLFIIAQIAAICWMPIMGLIIDKLNRVKAMIFGASVGGIGFMSTIFVSNPLDPVYIPIWAMLGIGQISCFFASQALIGQEAPVRERGSVIGMFGLFGAVGILVATKIGGQIFDSIGPYAPFFLVGAMDALVAIVAIFVWLKAPGRDPAEPHAQPVGPLSPTVGVSIASRDVAAVAMSDQDDKKTDPQRAKATDKTAPDAERHDGSAPGVSAEAPPSPAPKTV